MTIGIYTDMIQYNEQFYTGFIETVQKNLDTFNAASQGAMTLTTRFHKGLISEQAFFLESDSTFRRTLGSVAAHTPTGISSDDINKVKLFDAYHVEQTLESFRLQGMNEEMIARIAGEQAGAQIIANWQEAAISSIVGAYKLAALQPGGAQELSVDITAVGDGSMTPVALNSAKRLMGDKAQRIRAWVMHSAVYYSLVENQMTSTTADGIADLTVMTGTPATLGIPVIIVDSDALVVDNGSAAPSYLTFGLTEGAITVEESEERATLIERVGGLQNLVMRVQSEYAYTVGLKGISYASATMNPANSVLATGASWAIKHTSKKNLPGVMIESLSN